MSYSKIQRFILACLFTIGSIDPLYSQSIDPEFVELSDKFFQKFSKKINNRALVVGLYFQGKDTIISYGRINFLGRKVDEDDLFQIGSVSKTFTGLLFAESVVRGEMQLEDKLSTYLDIRKASKYGATTLLQLATHTSGLPNNTLTLHALPALSYISLSFGKRPLLEAISAPQIFTDVPWQIAIIPPPVPYFSTYGRGSVDFDLNLYGLKKGKIGAMKYSNLGMGLLGRIVSESHFSSYEEALRNTICDPLEMKTTTTIPSKTEKRKYATPHNLLGMRVFRTKFKEGGIEGAGGIKSTGRDMMKYLKLQMEGIPNSSLLEAVNLQQKTHFISEDPKKQGLELGLGWIKYNPDKDDATTIIWHNGQVSGSSAFIGFNPEKKIGLFVLSNNPRAGKLTKDSFRILNQMLKN